jgi:branched-chain amino acid transport system permease protein
MQEQSITAGQFSFQAGLPIFLVAVVGGLSSVGTGLFTGAALVGPISALVEVAPGLQNFTALLPGLAGITLGRSPSGVVPMMRGQWAPVARRKALALGLLVVALVLWVLRLTGAVNGWVLFWGTLIAALAVQLHGRSRDGQGQRGPAAGVGASGASGVAGAASLPGPDVPVEWWGLGRPWRAEDEEVLDRVIARG